MRLLPWSWSEWPGKRKGQPPHQGEPTERRPARSFFVMITCALLGYGWWGRTIARRIAGSDQIKIRSVVDQAEAARRDAAGAGFAVGEDINDALKDSAIDAVIVATPHSLHEAQVVASAQAGKHVFCEKPLGLTLGSAQRSVAACRSAGVRLGIGHERRFEPAVERLAQLVRSGELGEILHAEADFSHDLIAGLPDDNWRNDPRECPAGAMTGSGVHLTDMLIWMLGRADRVSAMTVRLAGRDVGTSVQLRFAGGATATIGAILATPLYIRCRVFGTRAWAEVVNEAHPDSPSGATRLLVMRSGKEPTVDVFAWKDTIRANLEAFAAAVEGRAVYGFTEAELLHNIELLEAITTSARDHRTIMLR
jgi:predicted dehydrogenase